MEYITETKDFKILAHGLDKELNPNKVEVKAVPYQEIPFDNEIHDLLGKLDTLKSEAVYEAKTAGRNISAGPQWGLADYEIKNNTLVLSFKPVTYYDNMMDWKLAQNPELQKRVLEVSEEKLGDSYALLGRVLAANTSVKVLSEDAYAESKKEIESMKSEETPLELPEEAYNTFILNFRGADQAEYWLNFHNIGGHPKRGDKPEDTVVHDWHYVMTTQLVNELGIDQIDVAKMNAIGLAENTHTRKPDLLFETYINKTAKQILLGEDGIERDESLGLISLNGLGGLYTFVKNNQEKGKIYHPEDVSPAYKFLTNSVIKSKGGLDPNTNSNFCPVGEAQMALELQLNSYDVSEIYNRE